MKFILYLMFVYTNAYKTEQCRDVSWFFYLPKEKEKKCSLFLFLL